MRANATMSLQGVGKAYSGQKFLLQNKGIAINIAINASPVIKPEASNKPLSRGQGSFTSWKSP